MRYVRTFSAAELEPGQRSDWLIAPEEGVGCTVRMARGGGAPRAAAADRDLFALVLCGDVDLAGGGPDTSASPGSLVILPAGRSATLHGSAEASWIEVEAAPSASLPGPRVVEIDQNRFVGDGFAHQSMADRETGVDSMRINTLRVGPGAGSPDFHIHTFAQIYIVTEGEMTLDIGRARQTARAGSIVVLPPGVVHRNFNASRALERHVSLLVPEPASGEIFDYAVDIHPREAELLQELPA